MDVERFSRIGCVSLRGSMFAGKTYAGAMKECPASTGPAVLS